MYCLPPIIRRVRADHPNLELVIRTETTVGIVGSMMANAIDLGLVTLPVTAPGFHVWTIRSDPMQAIFPAEGPTPPAEVTPQALADQDIIFEHASSNTSRLINEWFAQAGVSKRPVIEVDNVESIKVLVRSGLGMSIIPAESPITDPDGIVVRPLAPPIQRPLGIIQRRDKPDGPALRTVREALREIADQSFTAARGSAAAAPSAP